jgi:penicillin-binding protein 2
MTNILGDFYEKLPGDKGKRHVSEDFENEGGWDEETGAVKNGEKDSEEREKKRPFFWLYILVAIVALVLCGKLWSLQIVQGSYFRYLAEGNRIRTKNITALRGVIYDRSGGLLARNVAAFNIEIYPVDLPKDQAERKILYQKISKLIDVSQKEIAKKAEKKDINPLDPVILKEKIKRQDALVLKEKLIDYPALAIVEAATRDYESKWGLAHILGYVGKISEEELKNKIDYYLTDYIGKVGLEASYEEELKGINGKQQVEVDAGGKIARILAERESREGNNLMTTIDLGLQKKIYQVLKNEVKKYRGKGSVVAINPQNGEVLAMVSLPDYNNNIFTQYEGKKFSEAYKKLIEDKNNPMFNRAISGTYPPGSSTKPIAAAAALQEKIIDVNTSIFDPGTIEVPNKYNPKIIYKFHCWKLSGHGWISVIQAIAQSCDTFFYGVGGGYDKIIGLGIKKIKKYYNLFGYGEKSGIDLSGEAEGLVPDPKWKQAARKESWYLGDNYMLTIGQGDLLVTPLQLLMATSTIANGGALLKPHIVKEIVSSDGKSIKKIGREIVRKNFISKKNIDIVRQGMRAVVVSGTAQELSSLLVSSAGKTGTAEFNNKKDFHAWYTAFAPYENPKIALVVLVEGAGEGNEIAVPIAKEILNYYFTR